ncbi:MAG: FAD:protein FMN transferase [Clostridiales bacterium]|nr:FAD:protein FMN transferase [Clostridiales bacterium]
MIRKICILLVLALLMPASAPAESYQKYSRYTVGIFDTDVTLIGYTHSQEHFNKTADALFARLNEYNGIFDAYNSYPGVNNLWTVNTYAGKYPVQIPQPLFDLISWCKQQWESGQKGANTAMGAVLSIWHDYRTLGKENPAMAVLPPMEDLIAANAHTDFSNVILDPEAMTVFFADPAISLDIGSVAKGYVGDLVAPFLYAEMPSFLLSLGGNVCAGDPPRDGRKHWGVSVQDPDDFSGMLDVLYVDGVSVVTSGDYWRYYEVDGVRYHHIIDPDTLMPARHIQAVTVVCESSLMADYLTTTLFLMPYEEGLALIESIEGVEALWSLLDGSVHMSSGMAQYARSKGATAYQ